MLDNQAIDFLTDKLSVPGAESAWLPIRSHDGSSHKF